MAPTSFPAPPIDLDVLSRVGEALADENRQRILVDLLGGPAHPAELADRLGLSRTNVSNHLACLRGCGLVIATPVGRRIRYELADPRLAEAFTILSSLELKQPEGCEHQR